MVNSGQASQVEDLSTEDAGHDKLAWRLCDILRRFNNGEQLDVDELASEYGVHRRTIIRDLTERFAFLPIERAGKRYVLDMAYLGRLSFRDIERFAVLAGLDGLFPSLDTEFFRELFDGRLRDAFSIYGASHEDLHAHIDIFRSVQRAVTERRLLRFTYLKDEASKKVEAEPYRLVNSNGIWYLAAVNGGKPKAYTLSKLRAPELLDSNFTVDPAIVSMLDKEDSIWLSNQKTEVVLSVAPAAAPYFLRRKLIAQQTLERKLDDGTLIISGKFAHPSQILPIVRYWLPNVRILEPTLWQEQLEEGLNTYLAAPQKKA